MKIFCHSCTYTASNSHIGEDEMDRTVQVLFEVSRSLRILLDHFGLEDTALAVPGVFCCVPISGYPTVYFQGSYLDCRCYQALHSGYTVLSSAESQLRADCHEIIQGQSYDLEYRAMLRENRLLDKELKRRQKVRRRRRYKPP